jgi:zona occludens toxin
MITLITGVPGSGKTLYAISKLLAPLVGEMIPIEEDGVTTMHPRTVYTNINGLLLDHELIDGGDNQGLKDWHTWAKPGSVICFDEFQKPWPPRPNGAKVPDDIQALDTHRHMGVDFILVTQNCMNVDRHVIGLVGRHLHIRRVANMALSVVYEWDHASKSLLFKNSITKSPWRFDKKIYKLYKSAEVHTKQPRKMPGLVWFILLGLAGFAYMGPSLYNRLHERIGGKPPLLKIAVTPKIGEKTSYVKDGIEYTVETTQNALLPALAASSPLQPVKPKIAGCFQAGSKCGCLDVDGEAAIVETGFCQAQILGHSSPGQKQADLSIIAEPPAPVQQSDLDTLAFMARNRNSSFR